MIHKVKYGYMEVVPEASLTAERSPDLTFKGALGRVFGVFFAPFDTIEADLMMAGRSDYYAPFEAEYSDEEAEEILRQEAAHNDEPL